MREEILRLIEKNSRIDIHEMAILLGAEGGGSCQRHSGYGKGSVYVDITHLLIGIKLTMKK